MGTCKDTRKLFSCLMLGSHEGDLLRLHLNATAHHVAAWIVVEATPSTRRQVIAPAPG